MYTQKCMLKPGSLKYATRVCHVVDCGSIEIEGIKPNLRNPSFNILLTTTSWVYLQ